MRDNGTALALGVAIKGVRPPTNEKTLTDYATAITWRQWRQDDAALHRHGYNLLQAWTGRQV